METESNHLKAANELLERELQQKDLHIRRMERELQVEASLEKIRARTMTMRQSSELNQVVATLYEQLSLLEVSDWGGNIMIFHEPEGSIEIWLSAKPVEVFPTSFFFRQIGHPTINQFWELWRSKAQRSFISLKGKEKVSYDDFLLTQTDFRLFTDEMKAAIRNQKKVHFSFATMRYGLVTAIDSNSPLSEDNFTILQRFAQVFEQAYTRFLDLQKAEAQAREARIETALERVRSRTMAMHHSEELAEAATVMYQQLLGLGISPIACAFIIFEDKKPVAKVWIATGGQFFPDAFELPYAGEPAQNRLYEAWERKELFHVEDLSGEALAGHLNFVADNMPVGTMLESTGNAHPDRLVIHAAYFSRGFLGFNYLEPQLDQQEIFQRFAKVFNQTYTRFLDLQKAEAQAREAQIEAALERVRARSMAMHHTRELSEVTRVVFEQIKSLGIPIYRNWIGIVSEKEGFVLLYITDVGGDLIPDCIKVPIVPGPIKVLVEKWKTGTPYIEYAYKGQEVKAWIESIHALTGASTFIYDEYPEAVFYLEANNRYGALSIASFEPIKPEIKSILSRFTKVFEQTYTRFLDLQKAEAQAREAQIEAALERVRSRAMAMQSSDELREVSEILFKQVKELGIETWTTGFNVWSDDNNFYDDYLIDLSGNFVEPYTIDTSQCSVFVEIREAKKRGEKFFVQHTEGEQQMELYDTIGSILEKSSPGFLSSGFSPPPHQYNHFAFGGKVSLLFITYEPVPEAHDIFRRFGKVFEQTYTRFLDIQKAEAQAREAQIEAALERVRSRSMAIQNSSELNDVLATMFHELSGLGAKLVRCIIWIMDPASQSFKWYSANTEAATGTNVYHIPYLNHPLFRNYLQAWEERRSRWVQVLEGDFKKSWEDLIFNETELSRLPEPVKAGMRAPEIAYANNTFNEFGVLVLGTNQPIDDSTFSVLERFSRVFEQAYTRFNDLKIAEARTKDAVKQASLDRVRAEIASMRSTEDLQRITPLIWHELTVLGVPFFRCGVFIIDEAQEIVHSYLSTPEGHSLAVMELPFDVNEMTTQVVTHWKQNRVFKEHWNKEQFVSWMQSMVEQHRLQNPTVYQASPTPPESLFLHFIPFKQGMLYVGSTEVLSEDEIELIQNLAAAFSIAYARYEDFKQLEEAKTKVEATLDELKSTQAQLIQSEKMASLGELTAGIAHEIQNPLNFVNNYSEVNVELIEEIKEEIEKGNALGILELVTDLEDNETKIVHHGKRADSIVRGMLQHSRTSSGTKEPTDLNALADEYLRLAYHGLRAKDSSFQADYSTDFDPALPLIKVVPQDIGRVLLNIINNAFQACHERCCAQIHPDYAPKVTISTQNRGEFIEIRIQDNGGGIPEAIKDKIFQPFFTTKPTGQGTGLGLSLAYDSVKAHGGELSVESNEGEGTTFILSLPL